MFSKVFNRWVSINIFVNRMTLLGYKDSLLPEYKRVCGSQIKIVFNCVFHRAFFCEETNRAQTIYDRSNFWQLDEATLFSGSDCLFIFFPVNFWHSFWNSQNFDFVFPKILQSFSCSLQKKAQCLKFWRVAFWAERAWFCMIVWCCWESKHVCFSCPLRFSKA